MRTRSRILGVLAASMLLSTKLLAADWLVEPVAAYNHLFHPNDDWIGGDGAYSVKLTNDLTLWLFSDTFIGEVRDGTRVNAKMINNSVGLQRGSDPARTTVQFCYGKSPDGKPETLITPKDGRGWFWLYDGMLAERGLFLFLMQIERGDGNSVFDFKHSATWLGHVANPLDPPTQWRVSQQRIPHETFSPDETRLFGSGVLKDGGFAYIYGTAERKNDGKSMILARVAADKLDDFAHWRFFDRTNWVAGHTNAAPLCPGMANEYSVSYQPSLGKFILIYTEMGLSPNILARLSTSPSGPWEPPITVYQCPEANWGGKIICYAAKAHPELASAPDELIVTYVAGSTDFGELANDARIYWPQFLKIKFGDR